MYSWISAADSNSTSRNGRIEESWRVASWRVLLTKIERKSWHNPEAHFTDTGATRDSELHWWFKRISRCGIDTLPVIRQLFQALEPCRAAAKGLRHETWNSSGRQGNVFVNPRSFFDPSHRGALHSLSQNSKGGIQVQASSGQPDTRSDERLRNIIPSPKRRPSTMSSFPTVGIPENSMTQ